MKTHYFLFCNDEILNAHSEGGIAAIEREMKDSDEYVLRGWNPADDKPSDLLDIALEWDGYIELSWETYNKLTSLT